jgi:hypothetical protein
MKALLNHGKLSLLLALSLCQIGYEYFGDERWSEDDANAIISSSSAWDGKPMHQFCR